MSEDDPTTMDDILNNALDELDDSDDSDCTSNHSNDNTVKQSMDSKFPSPSLANANGSSRHIHADDDKIPWDSTWGPQEDELKQLDDMMKELLSSTASEENLDQTILEKVMTKLQEQMEFETKEWKERKKETSYEQSIPNSSPKENKDDVNVGQANSPLAESSLYAQKEGQEKPMQRPIFGPEPPPGMKNRHRKDATVEETISHLLQDMTAAATEAKTTTDASPNVDENDDEIMMMMNQLDSFLTKGGGEEMMEGVMQQLLSKELMYEPLQDVARQFPIWLQQHKDNLSETEYKSRCQQYEGMQRLISLYETEPENSERLLSCMKEVQEYGLPPKEIIAEVAPDLTLDDNGMPHLESLPECSII